MSDPLVWDAPFVGGGMTDAVCDFHTVTITTGPADEDSVMPSTEAVITLDNRSGEYSTRSVDGRLVYWALGRRVQLLGEAAGQWWWLFNGRVTGWDENADKTVTVTAHDGFAQLAADPGSQWTPGTAAQTVAQRVTAIAATWAYTDPLELDPTDVRLGAPVTERSPLEEMQTAALSDGGLLFCDADGPLVYWARTWTAGRVDQTWFRSFTDNVCEGGGHEVWDLTLLLDDVALASTVRLQNYERPTPKTASASLPPDVYQRPFVWTQPDDGLWTEQGDGDRLATDLLARYSTDSPRFEFVLYLHDTRQDLWQTGIDLRIGDRLNMVREQPAVDGPAMLDVDVLAMGITHEITPEEWLVTIQTGRVVSVRPLELWDETWLTWDDYLAVWRF